MQILLGNNVSENLTQYFNKMARHSKGIEILPATIGNYLRGEPYVELIRRPAKNPSLAQPPVPFNPDLVRGKDVAVIQSLSNPTSDNCLKLLFAVRTLKRYGATHVTAAMPFAAFGRQDRMFDNRLTSIGCDDFAFLLKQAGADRIITSELHSKASEKPYEIYFGKKNCTFLSSTKLFANDLFRRQNLKAEDIVIGAPDGADKPHDAGMKRAQDLIELYAKKFGVKPDQFFIEKKRDAFDKPSFQLQGNVKGRAALIVDDMTDTGGTIIGAATALRAAGARAIWVDLTHALLDEASLLNLLTQKTSDGANLIDRLTVTDTVPEFESILNKVAEKTPDARSRVTILRTNRQYEEAIKKQPHRATKARKKHGAEPG